MRLAEADVEAAREVTRRLDTLELGDPSGLEHLAPEFSRLFRLDHFLNYSLRIDADRVRLDRDAVCTAMAEGWKDKFDNVVQSTGPRFGHYDATRPEAWQRNRAHTRRQLEPRRPASPPMVRLYENLGIARLDQLRVLVCDQDTLLGWVGGFREEPFSARDKLLLSLLIPALGRRLSVERHLALSGLREAALHASLDALPCAAFVINAQATIVCANTLGQRRLATDRAATLAALCDALRHHGRTTVLVDGGYALTELHAPGLPRYFLAIHERAAGDPSARLAAAARRWTLTPRQTDVLALVAQGRSNRAISITLGCAERTVEIHVAALLTKIGAESRSEIVARFWTELPG